MERYAWRARVKEGCLDEYRRRHDRIWPEMKQVLSEAGIRNYTIFADGHELFGYYECAQGADFAQRVQNESEVVDRWNEYMADILIWDADRAQPRLQEVFRFEG
ncbi:MAG: L-rhamnose mutarotase [Clostridiales bacterium]|nr:L-rhamnose mutarotase [Clostridiales bacterium]